MESRLGLLVILLCSCCVLASPRYPDLSQFKRALKVEAQKCASAHNTQFMQVLAMMEAPLRTGYDRNSKCFVCCMMERYQMLTADGEFLDGNMRKICEEELPPSEMKTVAVKYLDTCLREDNDDICEKCYQFAKCYYDRSKIVNKGDMHHQYQQLDVNAHLVGQPSGHEGILQSVGNWAKGHINNAAFNLGMPVM